MSLTRVSSLPCCNFSAYVLIISLTISVCLERAFKISLIRFSLIRSSACSVFSSSRFGLLTVKGQNDAVSCIYIKKNKAGSQPGLPGLTGFHWVKFLIGFYLDPARPQARVDRVLGRPVGPGFKTMIDGALSFPCG